MYGGSKLEGSIVGRIQADGEEEEVDLEDLLNSTPVEEAYCCRDAEGAPIALMASLDTNSGDVVWEQRDTQTVLRRTVQMSQMVSMLHDKDRNEVYHEAIRRVIDSYFEKTGREPVVLDVGCGTGLLSCMAASTSRTRSIIGCEMFEAMATVAGAVVQENGLENVVQIVPSKSVEVELDDDDGSKADILISELLDSSLLGESVIFSHADAISRLMTHSQQQPHISDRVVPHSATVFAVLVECPELFDTYNVEHIMPLPESITPWRNADSSSCRGGRSVIPVHWRELKERSGGRELSAETPILTFEFFHAEVRDECEAVWETDIVVNEDSDGPVVHGVLLYWKLNLLSEALDPERKLFYSTKPGSQNWQDHWVQCAHVLPIPCATRRGEVFRIKAFHDNLRIWLECSRLDRDAAGNKRSKSEPLQMQVSPSSSPECDPPQCQCGWHLLCSPYRILALNDSRVRNLWNKAVYAMVDAIKSGGVILDVSDESILAIAAAKHLALSSSDSSRQIKVISREKKLLARLHAQQLAEANNLEEILEIWDGEGTLEETIDSLEEEEDEGEGDRSSSPPCIVGLVSECNYYQMSSCPVWAALAFHYQRTSLQPYFTPATIVLPSAARIMVVAYELQDLGVSHGLAGNVCGFDHSPLDRELLPHSQPEGSAWNDNWFPYKLADYAKRALTKPHCLATLDYQHPIQSIPESAAVVEFTASGRCDCIALFVDYYLDKVSSVSYLDAPYYKPNLKFFTDEERLVEPDTHMLQCSVQFEVGDSDFSYSIRLATRE